MNEKVFEEALGIVDVAARNSIPVNLLGSAAVLFYLRKPTSRPFVVKDIDLITLKRYQTRIQALLAKQGWRIAEHLLLVAENRETYTRPFADFTLDIYYDRIDANHSIDMRARLTNVTPPISFTDLLLSKLQRHVLREADAWDLCSLLTCSECIDRQYFVKILTNDWGFYTTVVDNLRLLCTSCRPAEQQVHQLVDWVVSARKSLRWTLRSIIGRRVKWWTEMYDAQVDLENTA